MKTFKICHLYGDLLNTYGDNGNLLMLKYIAASKGYEVEVDLVSLEEPLSPEGYDIIFIGGGQDFEQKIISKDIRDKAEALRQHIENGGVTLAICGGYQLLGKYYETADNEKIEGAGILPHYTKNQDHHRFIGNITIRNENHRETYVGFENHQGCTFLGPGEEPLGIVEEGYGNNGEDKSEGAIYKNCYCSYFHGPLLVRNEQLADRLVEQAIAQKKEQ